MSDLALCLIPPSFLRLHGLYPIIPDLGAEDRGELRIVDETGEERCFAASHFRVLSTPVIFGGGQAGVDQAGWRAAQRVGLDTCGFMTKDFVTEGALRPDGRPGPSERHFEFARLYGAIALDTTDYPTRTRANAAAGDLTLWFGDGDSRGFACTRTSCRVARRPFWPIGAGERPSALASRIREHVPGLRVLNVAGNRHSSDPALADRVEAFLVALFRRLARSTGPNHP